MSDKKELKDEELNGVSGGIKFNNLPNIPNQAGIGGGHETRTTSADSCSSFSRKPDAVGPIICANCIYFHKIGDSGVCNNTNKGLKTAVI